MIVVVEYFSVVSDSMKLCVLGGCMSGAGGLNNTSMELIASAPPAGGC